MAEIGVEDARRDQHRGGQAHPGMVGGGGQVAHLREEARGVLDGGDGHHRLERIDQHPERRVAALGVRGAVEPAHRAVTIQEPSQAVLVTGLGDGGLVAQHPEGRDADIVIERATGPERLERAAPRLGLQRQEGQQHIATAERGGGETWIGDRGGREPRREPAERERHGQNLTAWPFGRKRASRHAPGITPQTIRAPAPPIGWDL